MLSGAGGAMMGMTTGMSGPSGMGMGTGGHNFWQARQMSAGSMPHMAYTSGHGHQQHDAKMAEKIVTELQVWRMNFKVGATNPTLNSIEYQGVVIAFHRYEKLTSF